MDILSKSLRFLSGKSLSVLLFHKIPMEKDLLSSSNPNVSEFERTLDFISENFKVISLSDAVDGLRRNVLPKNAACLTFDDGYPDWLDSVIPALSTRNMHGTFFITSEQFNSEAMWHERINFIVKSRLKGDLALPKGLDLKLKVSPGNIKSLTEQLESYLKYSSVSDRDSCLREIEEINGISRSEVPRMNIEQLRAIHAKGFEIGAHTISHPILSLCTEDSAWQEIAGIKDILSDLIKGEVSLFAYPNGIPGQDFTADHVRMVRKAGYKAAVTTQHGVARCGESIYQIPRFTPWGPDSYRYSWQMIRNQLASVRYLEEQ